MLLLILIGFLVYRNGKTAKARGKNVVLWSLLTIVAIFCAYMVGMLLIVQFFYPSYLGANDIAKSQELAETIGRNWLQSFFILFCGVGGYLLIRYILERSKTGTTGDNE